MIKNNNSINLANSLSSVNIHSTLGPASRGMGDSMPFKLDEKLDKSPNTAWVPPNDRELIIRAKLKTGWSSRSNMNTLSNNNAATNDNNNNNLTVKNTIKSGQTSPMNNTSNIHQENHHHHHHHHNNNSKSQQLISDSEFLEIEQVMQRACMIEQKETDRINKLMHRYNQMNRPLGNGESTCLICNSNFGILGATPRICSDCLKNVCTTCSIDSLSSCKQTTIWLCKICAEYRDFLKKSGAWFNKRVPIQIQPQAALTQPSSSSNELSTTLSNENIKSKASSNIPCNSELKSSNTGIVQSASSATIQQNTPRDLRKEKFIKELVKNNNSGLSDPDLENSSNRNTSCSYNTETENDNSSHNESRHTANNITNVSNVINTSISNNNNNDNHFATNTNENDELSTKETAVKLGAVVSSSMSNTSLKKITEHCHNIDDFKLDNNIMEQIAASRHLDMSKLSSSTQLNHPHQAANTSVMDDSLSNLSMAFQQYGGKRSNYQLGSIQFNVEYIPTLLQLKIYLIGATSLPACDSNGLSDPYVKLHLLPGCAKATKLRSKTVYKNLNPQYNEYFHYDGVTVQDMDVKTLRLTMLDEDKFGFDFIGEYRLPLKTLLRNEVNHFNVPLEDKQELGDETDTTFRGKINFALKYSKKNSCLFVKINRCTQLLPMDNGISSDPFVEVCLSPYSKETKQKFKSSVKWKTLDPEYLEEFKFTNIDLKTLLTKTLEISVWDKDFGKNDFIGIVQLGQMRTGEELKHFFTMVKNPELYHEQWHTLHLRFNDESIMDN